jgi:hypothetical protein
MGVLRHHDPARRLVDMGDRASHKIPQDTAELRLV